jgi:hypothetical protein
MEFKTVACNELSCLVYIEVQRAKEQMRLQQYNHEFGATAGCVLRCQDNTTDEEGQKKLL